MRHSLRSLRRHRSATTFLSVVSCSPKISSPTARDRRRMISCNHGGTQVLTVALLFSANVGGAPGGDRGLSLSCNHGDTHLLAVAHLFFVRTTTSPTSFMRLD